MRVSFSRPTVWLLGCASAAWFAFACTAAPDTTLQPTGTGGSTLTGGGAGLGSGGTSAGTGGSPAGSGTGGSSGASTAGSSAVGGNAGVGVSAGGTSNTAGMGSGGSNSGSGGTAGSGGNGGTGLGTPSCQGITDAGFEVCSSGPGFCAAMFTDGEGCAAVCAAAGLECGEVWENEEDSCAADTSRAQLSCPGSGHDSDYCLCQGNGSPGTGGSAGMGGNAGTGGGAGRGGSAGIGSGGSSSGTSGSGGTTGGRSGAGGMASGGTGNVPAIGPGPCGCETPAGEFGTVDSTIVVDAGEVYDGACKIFRANPDTLGAGNQDEGQLPIFRVEDGGTLKNVVIGASGADGVHLYGDVTLENIHWLDIGEDAMTVKESGTVYLNCGSSAHGEDKTFQVNAASTIFISNFTATDAGKFMRQNGDTTFEVNVTIDHCDISFMDESIFRTDSSSSHVTFTNSRYSNLGDGLFIFGEAVVNGNSAQSTVSNIVEY
jgi:hypothetical protein